jgi:hypothetical protein
VMNAAGALVDVGASDFSEFPEGVKWNEMKEASQAPTHEAFSDFCHALLSSNEFLYLH